MDIPDSETYFEDASIHHLVNVLEHLPSIWGQCDLGSTRGPRGWIMMMSHSSWGQKFGTRLHLLTEGEGGGKGTHRPHY